MIPSAFRVGVVGARRVRQGTGEHLARLFHAAGTKVVAVCGTGAQTAAEAASALKERYGIAAAAHPSLEEMIAHARLHALAIASPAEAHAEALDAAAAAELHVLCEKPLLPGLPGDEETARRLAQSFAKKSRCLAVTAQWRHALPAYLLLFPDVSPRAASSFEMETGPASEGEAMLVDSCPHAIAIADALYGATDEPLQDVSVAFSSAERAEVSFTHPGGRRGVRCRVRLARATTTPRPMAFGFDGRLARREVEMPGYRLRLVDVATGRSVPLADPLETRVFEFVARVRKRGPFPPDPALVSGVARLAQLRNAAKTSQTQN